MKKDKFNYPFIVLKAIDMIENPQMRLRFFDAVLDYGLDEIDVDFEDVQENFPLANTLWSIIKYEIDINNKTIPKEEPF